MATSWDVLLHAGVPDGVVRPASARSLDDASVAAALLHLSFAELDLPQWECLSAWLAAFHHHWPERFAALPDGAGRHALERCASVRLDPNRYLKLRRIAIENLAQRL